MDANPLASDPFPTHAINPPPPPCPGTAHTRALCAGLLQVQIFDESRGNGRSFSSNRVFEPGCSQQTVFEESGVGTMIERTLYVHVSAARPHVHGTLCVMCVSAI